MSAHLRHGEYEGEFLTGGVSLISNCLTFLPNHCQSHLDLVS